MGVIAPCQRFYRFYRQVRLPRQLLTCEVLQCTCRTRPDGAADCGVSTQGRQRRYRASGHDGSLRRAIHRKDLQGTRRSTACLRARPLVAQQHYERPDAVEQWAHLGRG